MQFRVPAADDLDPELIGFGVFGLLAGIGASLHGTVLALFGALGAMACLVAYLWQRNCLVGLRYSRHVGQRRAEFGEKVALECELFNDKVLPLPWVRVADLVPDGLSFEGASVSAPEAGGPRSLEQGFSLLPFERRVRQITIGCDRRGRHRFGASEVRSGDPLGLRHRSMTLERHDELIVYPKIFSLPLLELVSRTPLGDHRARSLLVDPSRVAGMRPYRSGDSLRHVDWRASARSTELLVRDFESTADPRVAVFFEIGRTRSPEALDRQELLLSVTASALVQLALRGMPVGLFGPGLADGDPIGFDPSSAPSALGSMLELLALCEPAGRHLGTVLDEQAPRLRHRSLILVVASRFDEVLLGALHRARRRSPVSALYLDGPGSVPPPAASIDHLYRFDCPDDWQQQTALHLAG